ncbi:ABC transporter permease [Candidatus Woesearchaeota archaeon]|nr:ABC transporter permease [Candidatus Woesearchaeota archaeon]
MDFIAIKDRVKSIAGLTLSIGIADFKLRNEGSYLGILWYLLNPLLMFGFLWFVFANILGNDIQYYPLYLLIGIIMYNLFQMCVSESMTAIRGNGGIIKSVNFPRESLVTSIIAKFFLSHIAEYIVLLILFFYFKIPLSQSLLYLIAILMFIPVIVGLSLIFASVTVYFVDFINIWDFVARVLFFLTPIFHQLIPYSKLYYINLMNPLYHFITLARELCLNGTMPDITIIIGSITFAIFTPILGLVIFRRLKYKFAELI